MTMIQKMARAMADDDWQRRVAEIEASQKTRRPISMGGPFSGLDYKICAAVWDRTADTYSLKAEWLVRARAALTAMLEPTQTMTDAYFDLCDIGGDLTGDATLEMAFAVMIQAALDEPTTPPS